MSSSPLVPSSTEKEGGRMPINAANVVNKAATSKIETEKGKEDQGHTKARVPLPSSRMPKKSSVRLKSSILFVKHSNKKLIIYSLKKARATSLERRMQIAGEGFMAIREQERLIHTSIPYAPVSMHSPSPEYGGTQSKEMYASSAGPAYVATSRGLPHQNDSTREAPNDTDPSNEHVDEDIDAADKTPRQFFRDARRRGDIHLSGLPQPSRIIITHNPTFNTFEQPLGNIAPRVTSSNGPAPPGQSMLEHRKNRKRDPKKVAARDYFDTAAYNHNPTGYDEAFKYVAGYDCTNIASLSGCAKGGPFIDNGERGPKTVLNTALTNHYLQKYHSETPPFKHPNLHDKCQDWHEGLSDDDKRKVRVFSMGFVEGKLPRNAQDYIKQLKSSTMVAGAQNAAIPNTMSTYTTNIPAADTTVTRRKRRANIALPDTTDTMSDRSCSKKQRTPTGACMPGTSGTVVSKLDNQPSAAYTSVVLHQSANKMGANSDDGPNVHQSMISSLTSSTEDTTITLPRSDTLLSAERFNSSTNLANYLLHVKANAVGIEANDTAPNRATFDADEFDVDLATEASFTNTPENQVLDATDQDVGSAPRMTFEQVRAYGLRRRWP